MNRCEQVLEAIDSCLASVLPEKTQFVVVDNGSTDGTEAAVKHALQTALKPFVYRKSPENIGVGPGRNLLYTLAEGEYAYFLDDDAVIAEPCRDTFFTVPLAYMDRNPCVYSLTTRISDTALGYDRDAILSRAPKIDACAQMFMFHGGSHFLRVGAFHEPLYLALRYGYEELTPSLETYAAGGRHVWMPEVYVVHQPKVNKWKSGTERAVRMRKIDCYMPYVLKRRIYPRCLLPVLWFLFRLRMRRHLAGDAQAKRECLAEAKELYRKLGAEKTEKLRFCTVLHLVKDFGVTAL